MLLAFGLNGDFVPAPSSWTLTEESREGQEICHLWKEEEVPLQLSNPPLLKMTFSTPTPGRQWPGAGGEPDSTKPSPERAPASPYQSSRTTTIVSAQRYIKAIRMMIGIGTPRK